MPQIINTNIASLTAQRNLDRSQSANQQALSRLSSGLRINSSKDDAAGLAISTRFSSQIRGLNVAIRNVGDGVSLAQTADGALGTMTDNLQRIRELAIQSANATNSDVDREALQAEVDQLVAEISRTGEQTSFNGINLLDGDFNATFQIGANVGETVSFGISELTADSLGGGKAAGVSALGSSSALGNGDLVINGVVIGASTAADDSASTSNAAASAIAKAAAINKSSDDTGVTAQVLTNVASGSAMQDTAGGANAASGTINLNGVDISIATGDVDSAADRAAVVTAINARSDETGVVAVDSGSAQGGVTLEASDGRNISLSFSSEGSDNLSAASTGLTSAAVTTGGYTLTSADGSSPVVITAGTGSLSNAGLVEGSFSANTAAVNSTSRSSRAEVTSDAGDTGPLAATITGGEAVDLSNANYFAGDTTFDLTISGATSSYENATATVTLNGDFRDSSLQDLVDEINSDLAGNIAAEAFVLDGDKLGFRRTSTEAGDLQLGNFTTGSVPGGNTTIIASLGLQATDTIGASTVLDSDTNAARGGQAGRAALTATPAVNAAIASDGDILDGTTGLAQFDFSAVGDQAQFDITIAGASTASENGTYTVTVDTDFTNALFSGFETDAEDRQRVLDELNADLASAGAGDYIEAKFNPGVTKLVFERKTAETGGSVEIGNYVTSGNTSTTDIANAFGFTADRISTDGTANSTVGADAKAPGASDAIGGTATGIDTDSALISGGIANATTDAFTAFAAATAASVTAGSATDTDFSDSAAVYTGTGAAGAADFSGAGDALSFTLTDANGNVDNIVYNADATSVANLATALDALVVNATDITITESGGELVFTSTSTGRAAEVTISNLVEGANASGLADGSTYGGGESSFTVNDGTTSVNVSLTTDLTDADGVAAEINSQLLAGGSSILATNGGGTLTFASTDTGQDATVLISATNEGDSNTGFSNGLTNGTDGDYNLTFQLDGVETTVDLRGAGTVTNAGGGTVIADYISSISGLTASYTAATNQFTIAASNGTTDLQLIDGGDSALEYLGLSAGTYAHTPEVTGTETVAAVELSGLNEGDLKINGVTIGSSSAASDSASSSLAESSDKAASGIAIAAAINSASGETGVSATVNATVVDGGETTARNADGDQGVVYINGFATGTLTLGADSETNRTDAVSAINQISGQSGVTAEDVGGYIRLTAADGRNISVAMDNLGTTFTGSNIGLSSSQGGIAEADFAGTGGSYASVAETTASTVTLSSAKEFNIAAGTNGTAGLAGLGLVAGTYGGAEDGQFLTDIDISTVEGAEAAILALDNAIATVSSQRADLGAIQNRLESTVGNLTVTAENLTAANSRILDADFAVETAELSRSQVLQQAGISILAQANASSQQVLSLLQ